MKLGDKNLDFKLLYYVIKMIPIDTIVNILGLFATFGGALVGAFIAGLFTLKAINKDLEERKQTAEKDKEENNRLYQIIKSKANKELYKHIPISGTVLLRL